MKIIISMLLLFAVGLVFSEVSLVDPISIKLSQQEILENESIIREKKFDGKDFDGVFIFEGVFKKKIKKSKNEFIYIFSIRSILRKNNETFSPGTDIAVISPAGELNGGVSLKRQCLYRVVSPKMPDGRYAAWRGTILEIKLQKDAGGIKK